MQLWTIVKKATPTQVVVIVHPTAGPNVQPKDQGCAWDDTLLAVKISAAPDVALQTWDGGKWADNATAIDTMLVAKVKVEAERRKMMTATVGGYKKSEYAEKRAEVIAWEVLGLTETARIAAFNLLAIPVRSLRFEWAIASAAEFGEATLTPAIARFRAGLLAASSAAKVGAREEKVVFDVRAAPTVAAKRAAVAASTWF